MLGKTFNARVSREHKQVGIREVFSVTADGDCYDIKLLFGLDRALNPTSPAVYTKSGFALINSVVDINNQAEFTEYISARRGIYSLLGYTQLVCEVTGKISNFDWKSFDINYYVLGGLKSMNEVYGERVSGKGAYGSNAFHLENKLTELLKTNLLLSLPSKIKFYADRCRKC